MKNPILFILLFIFFSSTLKSEEINVMFNRNYYPFEFINDDGIPDGFTIDLIYAVARESTLAINLIEENWKSREDLLFNGVIDISPGYLLDIENPSIINSKPLFSVPFALLYKGNTTFTDEKALNNKTLVISSGDSSDILISAVRNPEKLIRTKSWSDSIKALSIGYGDYTIITRVHSNIMENQYQEELKEINSFTLILPFGFYSTRWNKNTLDKFNNGISIIKASGEFDRIYRKWFDTAENLIIKRLDSRQSTSIYILATVLSLVVFIIYNNKRKVKK